MTRKLRWTAALLLLPAVALCAGGRRVRLIPKLQRGQTITYLIRFHSDKTVKTESKVIAPMGPNAAQLDANGLLRVEILDVRETGGKAAIHARAQFLALDSGVSPKMNGATNPGGEKQSAEPASKFVDFTISPDGSVNNPNGLDSLSLSQQQAWQQWVARFALAWTLPPNGMKSGEKWISQQTEKAESPIGGLVWQRQSIYVKDEPCPASHLAVTGEVSPSNVSSDTCAVLLTTAKLKQKSSSKDATSEDFKLHELRTMGTAKGTDEVITYISLTSSLVVRATEETSQFMDVIVAKADGSNQVHYNVDAKSHAEVLLVAETAPNQP
jgi:hypothetical protein